jgi:hypothetical protein
MIGAQPVAIRVPAPQPRVVQGVVGDAERVHPHVTYPLPMRCGEGPSLHRRVSGIPFPLRQLALGSAARSTPVRLSITTAARLT